MEDYERKAIERCVRPVQMAIDALSLPPRKEDKMNKELIEKLKDKSQATNYILRTKEEQEILYKAKLKGSALVLFANPTGPEWLTAGSDSTKRLLDTLILKPGYQPEPEYVDIEIRASSEIRLRLSPQYHGHTLLRDAIECKDFDGFYRRYPGKKTYDQITAIDSVARVVREGHQVYARFVKE